MSSPPCRADEGTRSPERWFHTTATIYVESQILFHLNQVGVLAFLCENGPCTAAQIAESLTLNAPATDALLDYVFEVDELLDRDCDGRYCLSDFGTQVIERFSSTSPSGDGPAINMFDVRVGGYGPVWQNLGSLLRGAGRYGQEFHRDGRFAETGVAKLAMRFWDSLTHHLEDAAVGSVVEVGLTTGLVERLAQEYDTLALYGVDRSDAAVMRTAESLSAKGLTNVGLVQCDFFDISRWTDAVDPETPGLVYSLHFHELLARGEPAFVTALRELRSRLPGWSVLAFEQPRLAHEDKANIPETQWLYSQSNVLIHHLIGNGRILSRDAWIDLGRQAGCRSVTDRACDYLGYRAFLFRL